MSFYTSDNSEKYNVFSSNNRDERQSIKRLLTEKGQAEIEKIAEYMIEQHTVNNKIIWQSHLKKPIILNNN